MNTSAKIQPQFLITKDNVKIYYDRYVHPESMGSIFLVHGATGDTNAWLWMRELFYEKKISTYGIDLRGHGASDRGKSNDFFKVEHVIDDILAVAKKENLKNYHLVGHCYGGNVCIQLAAEHPQNIASLILINTSSKTSITNVYRRLGLVRKAFVAMSLSLPNIGHPQKTDFKPYIGTGNLHPGRLLRTLWTNTVKNNFLTFDKVFSLNNEDNLAKLAMPVCIITGTNDIFFSPKEAYRIGKKIPNATVKIIEKADHIVVLNKPAEVVRIILDFINEIKK